MILTTNKSHQKCKVLQVWKNKILKVKITREIGLSIPRVNNQQKKSNWLRRFRWWMYLEEN